MREPLSVVIPTFNVEDIIRDCLESVKWADEIFVVDSFSADRTLDICREYTDRVVQHEYANYSTQNNWAVPQTSHKWVMVVDSDERVGEQLRDSIQGALENPGDCDGFYVKRENFFLGKHMRHGGWDRDYVIRLFNKERGRHREKSVHPGIEVDGKTGSLDGPLYHYTYDSFDEYFEKFHRYTKWAANDLKAGGRRASWVNLAARPWMRFLKMYVMDRGFLDGKHGLVLSLLAAFSVFTKYARLWEVDAKGASAESGGSERQGRAAAGDVQSQSSRGKS